MLSQWTEYEESPIVAIYFDKYKTKNKLQNPEIAQDFAFHPQKFGENLCHLLFFHHFCRLSHCSSSGSSPIEQRPTMVLEI